MDLTGTSALVTGASGFIGGALARRLAQHGLTVRGLMRRPQDPGVPGLTPVAGDLTDRDSLRAAAEGVDLVFHCAAYMSTKSLARARDVTVAGTRRLLEAMAASKVTRLIHLSSMAVYAATPPPLHEEARLRRPSSIYALTKLEAEAIIRRWDSALSWVMFRPPIVYGPGSPVWTRSFARQVRRRGWPILGDGQGRWHYVYVDNLIDALILAAEQEATGTYNIGDGVTPWADWVERHRRIVDGPEPRHLPLWLVKAAALVVGGRLGVPRSEDLTFLTRTNDDGFSAQRARDDLGWAPQVDLDEGLRRAAAWLREGGHLR